MSWEWLLFSTALLVFCLFVTYKVAFKKGYKAGALMVTSKWRSTLEEWEQSESNEHI